MLPSETMIWQPEFTDKTLSRKPGAVQTDEKKNLPLKSGILQDVEKYLADNPDVDLTIEEWNCAVQVMTFRWQYLQNCTVPGATRYDLYGKPAGTVKKAHATYAQLVLDARKKASEKKQLKRKG